MKRSLMILGFFFLTFSSLGAQEKECVVLLCNKKYFKKFLGTLDMLVNRGNYHGDICLVIGDDLLNDPGLEDDFLKKNHIIVKHFSDLKFPQNFLKIAKNRPRFDKLFQYHKLYLFDIYFKRWETILYIDCGMQIYRDIRPILDARTPNTLLAHSDAYPTYQRKLRGQFEKEPASYYSQLEEWFDLDIDYFQTTMMLYDTTIIEENTFEELYELLVAFPNTNTNEQAIMSLYFTNIKPCWRQIPLRNEETFFYDFYERGRPDPFIMIKYPNGCM